MGNAVAHFELQGPDPEGTAKFYSQVFGWHAESMPGEWPYVVVDTHSGKGINGGMGSSPDGGPHVNVYAEVDDIQKYLDKIESLGGKTIVPPMDAGNVRFAQFADPQGTAFGLFTGM